MEDRRQFERFPLTISTRMETVVSNRKQIFKLRATNISASGAFIDTSEKFSEGIRFKLDFTLPNNRIKELTGARGLIECEGSVVRSTAQGVAICFDMNCQIFSLKGL